MWLREWSQLSAFVLFGHCIRLIDYALICSSKFMTWCHVNKCSIPEFPAATESPPSPLHCAANRDLVVLRIQGHQSFYCGSNGIQAFFCKDEQKHKIAITVLICMFSFSTSIQGLELSPGPFAAVNLKVVWQQGCVVVTETLFNLKCTADLLCTLGLSS